MEINAHNLYRHVPPGSVMEITGAFRSTLASVVRAGWGKLVACPERPMREDGRVLIRIPLVGALLQATARLTPAPDGPDGAVATVVLDTFTNVRCWERRASVRLSEPMDVSLWSSHADGPRVLTALNVGPSGMLLGWPGSPEAALGERIRLTVRLDGFDIEADGEVIRVEANCTAVRFTRIDPEDQNHIVAGVFRRECERRPIRRGPGTPGQE